MSDKPSDKSRVTDALEDRLRREQREFLQRVQDGDDMPPPLMRGNPALPVGVKDEVLLDDGVFYVTLCHDQRGPRMASGVLRKRCAVGLHTPFGYDCIGQFSEQPGQAGMQWLAGINVRAEVGSGLEEYLVANRVERMEAIAALWMARHDAWARYADGMGS